MARRNHTPLALIAVAIVATVGIGAALVSGPPRPNEVAVQTVYVTSSGRMYHRAGCQYLWNSARAVSIERARRSYAPCSVCDP